MCPFVNLASESTGSDTSLRQMDVGNCRKQTGHAPPDPEANRGRVDGYARGAIGTTTDTTTSPRRLRSYGNARESVRIANHQT